MEHDLIFGLWLERWLTKTHLGLARDGSTTKSQWTLGYKNRTREPKAKRQERERERERERLFFLGEINHSADFSYVRLYLEF